MMTEGGFLHCLHGGAGREGKSEARTGARPAASGGDYFVVVLEFEFLSRIIASMQSMRCCRRSRRRLSRQLSRLKCGMLQRRSRRCLLAGRPISAASDFRQQPPDQRAEDKGPADD